MTQAPVDALLLAEVFDKVPSAIIVLDEQGYIKRANQSASKLLGIDSLENERWVELVSKVFRPRQDDGHEISTIDGRRLQVSSLDLQKGQLIQMNDLTQTRALQDKIAHMERLSSLGKMAASLAHQIRTPLSAAMLYAANLGNANLQPMARKRFQEKLMGRLEALEAQVSDILMFARSNEQTVTEIDASQLVDQTASNVSAVLAKGDAELETIADTGEMPILGNATALTGALSNLVANAVEAGANKIILKLTKDEEQNTITFSVANNGPAIPEELKQKIFEPFFTSKSSGTGLGLAVVSAVTKVHQGTLRLESWEPEYLTVFSITIPLYVGSELENTSLANTVSSLRGSLESSNTELQSEIPSNLNLNAISTSHVAHSSSATAKVTSSRSASMMGAIGGSMGSHIASSMSSSIGGAIGKDISSSVDGYNQVGVSLGYRASANGLTSAQFAGRRSGIELDENLTSTPIGVGSVNELSHFDGAMETNLSMGAGSLDGAYQNIHAQTLEYDTNREPLGSPLASLSTSGAVQQVNRPAHKRGQIGAANAVLVAAVQKPK